MFWLCVLHGLCMLGVCLVCACGCLFLSFYDMLFFLLHACLFVCGLLCCVLGMYFVMLVALLV